MIILSSLIAVVNKQTTGMGVRNGDFIILNSQNLYPRLLTLFTHIVSFYIKMDTDMLLFWIDIAYHQNYQKYFHNYLPISATETTSITSEKIISINIYRSSYLMHIFVNTIRPSQ